MLNLIHISEPKHTVRQSLRKAKAVLEYKPDIILFEYPMNGKTPETVFNQYSPVRKPRKRMEEWKNSFRQKELLKVHPWLKGDIKILENIERLWREGQQVMLYTIDAPVELTSQMFWAGKDKDVWPCWVINFLREQCMIKNLNYVEKKHQSKENPKVLVFMGNWHWANIKFLRKNPSKKEMWDRYFGKFRELEPGNIENKIKEKSKVLFKYWRKLSLW